MAEEDEVRMEVEAVESVYGDDCIVLNTFPPLLRLHLKPRTAEVHSQQFVEATIEIQAGAQYPSDPPYIDIISSKGLDEKRQKYLSTCLHNKARELESCLMIVSLCEEAVETLSSMNHPEGDCPLCLYPLLAEDELNKSQPFMKLMSCFHCFHCECIIRWLKWFLRQKEANHQNSSTDSSPLDDEFWQTSDLREMMGKSTGNCPVCRTVFLAKDIEHVLNLVGSHNINSDIEENEDKEELLNCPLETSRRHKFEEILELQKEHCGLIEPPKDNILFSRLSLEDLVVEPDTATNGEVIEPQETGQIDREAESGGSSNQTHQQSKRRQSGHMAHTATVEPGCSRSHTRPSTGQHQRSGPRKQGRSNSKVPPQQWSRKE
ncbi:uncharacterized protein LOC141605239 [Silene latifolia]|uniref:uncharacterized protein LOC141605239 n=1 Tax=Silene latifolia TaxID=37657 RepID=UPI003D781C55